MEQKLNDYIYLDTNNEHLHTLRGQPLIGTSSVADVLKKDGLTWWASGLAVKELGCTDGKVLTKIKNGKATPEERQEFEASASAVLENIKNMDLQEYLALIDRAYRAHNIKLADSAKEGTDMHAELEKYVKTCIDANNGIPLSSIDEVKAVEIFSEWAMNNVKRFLWSEMNCYSEVHWLGGITDCGYEKIDGTVGIMDFKSSKDAYDSQFFQCAGYAIEIEENGGYDNDGNKVFDLDGKKITELAVLPFGMENPEPQFYSKGVDVAKESFLAEVTLYKNMNFGKK